MTRKTSAPSDPPLPPRSAVDAVAHLNPLALSAFVTIASGRSFRETGEALHIEPSHVSKLIRRLESVLGVPVLNRTTRRITLTAAGIAALEPAQAALSALEELIKSVQQLS